MKTMVFALFAVAALAGVVGYIGPGFGQANGQPDIGYDSKAPHKR